jgi:hypothetical protein
MTRTRQLSAAALAAAGIAAAVVLTGCGQANSNTASRGVADSKANSVAGGGPAGKAPQAADGKPNTGVPVRYAVDGRSIVYTGSITIRVSGSVDEAAAKATAIATGAGGFVGADKRSSDGDNSQATLQLRVPAAKFTIALNDLSRLGKQESRDVSTDDVTEEVVDLDAKIATQQASVTRTRALFGQATTISEIVSVEAELAKRESELASLQARKRKLDDLTTLSTITVVLLGPQAAATKRDDKSGLLAGLSTGWHGFLGALRVLLTVLGFVLPFAAILGVPAGAGWWTLRRLRRLRRSPAPATAPPPAP